MTVYGIGEVILYPLYTTSMIFSADDGLYGKGLPNNKLIIEHNSNYMVKGCH